MRSLKQKAALLGALLALALLCAYPAAAQGKQWVDLATGVSNNAPATTRIYGYYADVKGVGQAFIICDPDTGEETGYAYVPGGVVGNVTKQAIDHYDRKQDLGWDNPKQVNQPQVVLFAPNIPTSMEWDWDYWEQTGQLRKKAVNQFGWPMDRSFDRYLPGSDPDYWLIIASVTNPNPFPVEISFDGRIYTWKTAWGSSADAISKSLTLTMSANETKYILLNRGKNGSYLCDCEGEWYNGGYVPGWTSADYDAGIARVLSPDYPDILKSGDKYGYYTTYVRWNGTNPVVYPLIPMRLAFDFHCHSYDERGSYWYYPYQGREFPECFGHAEYDPETEQWSVSVGFIYFKKPSGMTDAEWQAVYNTAVSKAVSALKPLFEKWYPKIPFMSVWWNDDGETLAVDGDTGYYRFSDDHQGWPDGRSPTFRIDFSYLEPAPPNNAPPVPGVSWSNNRWGGWLYTTSGAESSGAELSAPSIQGYPDPPEEKNWTMIEENAVGKGTYIRCRNADIRYYDTDWMDELPVVRARPVFIEKYSFVPVEGDTGYLTKQTVPGYLLWVDTVNRPVLNTSTQPVEIDAKHSYRDWTGYGYMYIAKQWRWTPADGWQYLGETSDGSRYSTWNVTIKVNQTVSGSNPDDFSGTWAPGWGSSALSFYWPKTTDLQARLTALADTVKKRQYVHGGYEYVDVPQVDAISVDGWMPGPSSVTLAAKESKFICSADKTFSIQFRREPHKHESWEESQQSVLNEISSNIIPLLSGSEETVFKESTVFTMGRTFNLGDGGVICGAQRYMVFRDWRWDREDDEYGWDKEYNTDKIGFGLNYGSTYHPYADIGFTRSSYISDDSPTNGLVVQSGDETLAQLLRLGNYSYQIYLSTGTPYGGRFWRFYASGDKKVYPEDYPQTR